jgi:hypothetical protein
VGTSFLLTKLTGAMTISPPPPTKKALICITKGWYMTITL